MCRNTLLLQMIDRSFDENGQDFNLVASVNLVAVVRIGIKPYISNDD